MGSQGRQCGSSVQRHSFEAKAKNRLEDLQELFYSLQHARRESRSGDVAMLEEQVNQMLREWKAELHEASPAHSLTVASPSSSELPSDIQRLLQLTAEDDDATSNLAKPVYEDRECISLAPYSHESTMLQEYHGDHMGVQGRSFEEEMLERLLREDTQAESSPHCQNGQLITQEQLTCHALCLHDPALHKLYSDSAPPDNAFSLVLSAPLTAFLGPKCALWDCPRPAVRSEWLLDYCSTFHATLALNEGADGHPPVVRPGGIDLKDGPFFSSLHAKSQNKAVGIPECEGAATAKSPWNAHELFDTYMLQAESIREWLFFDKPRRAFESGTRKQRSLPDHNGRGWHESRKQVMKDMGGLKRSYYMDPQPSPQFEWHLYEYELTDYDVCALYRLELKQVNRNKKGNRSKAQNEQVAALQNQIGRLPANLSAQDVKALPPEKGTTEPKSNQKELKTAEDNVLGGMQVANFDVHDTISTAFILEDNMSSYLASP
ncbi:hypothetical protein KP509_09G015100 [Ceratopteris richardii]|uniref:Transcription factor VOZ1 n=1 Tax=Ceratopteris richardii TaxID=49495 RepID=A0A8T2U4C0_CERRI|nr:hypothetical protein KP509_09G015100 [Ceratopteris richardii]